MTEAEKIAAIEGILHDLVKLTAFLSSPGKRRSFSTSPSEIIAAEADALHKVAEIVGVEVPLFTS